MKRIEKEFNTCDEEFVWSKIDFKNVADKISENQPVTTYECFIFLLRDPASQKEVFYQKFTDSIRNSIEDLEQFVLKKDSNIFGLIQFIQNSSDYMN